MAVDLSHSVPVRAGTRVEHVPVLIVGGSVVGVSAALFLQARGVPAVLVERHREVATRLRAKVFYPRTMEAYRAVGAADDAYAALDRTPPHAPLALVASLAGPERRRWLLPAAADVSAFSPCPSALVKQFDLERVVRHHAAARGADLRFGHRAVGLQQGPDGARVAVEGQDGGRYVVEAEYVLAADGSAGAVRELLGIGRQGSPVVAHIADVPFRADLRAVLDGRRLDLAWVDEPGRPFLSWYDELDAGVASITYDPDTVDPTTWTPEDCRARAAGLLGLPAGAVVADRVRTWAMSAWTAAEYRRGQVFLAGDAAHVTPPVGGFGANTGIHDAWHLSALIAQAHRTGRADVLDRYDAERRPVAALTVEQALLRLAGRPALRVDIPTDRSLFSEFAVTDGYRYRPTDPEGPDVAEPANWSGEPGTRLPHTAVRGGSSLDLVPLDRPLVLTGIPDSPWSDAARRLGLATDHDATLTARLRLGPAGALLVRPDAVVAWRAEQGHADPAAALRTADAADNLLGRH